MTPRDIICRSCRKDYSLAEGCTFCEPAKRQIVWPAMDPDRDSADLHALARRTVSLLKFQLDRLDRDIRNAPTGAYDPDASAQLSKLSRAVANILTEARKLEEREEERMKGATFEQMLEIYGEWILGLPREYQARTMDWLERKLLPEPEAELVP